MTTVPGAELGINRRCLQRQHFTIVSTVNRVLYGVVPSSNTKEEHKTCSKLLSNNRAQRILLFAGKRVLLITLLFFLLNNFEW